MGVGTFHPSHKNGHLGAYISRSGHLPAGNNSMCAILRVCDEHVWKMYRYTSRIFLAYQRREEIVPLLIT